MLEITRDGNFLVALETFLTFSKETFVDKKEIQITLTVKEIDMILALIAKQPLGEVLDLFNKIRSQAIPQLATVEPPKEPESNE